MTTVTSRPSALMFARKFLKHGRQVASIAPSSRYLCAAMCRGVDASRPQVIVELGSGTGPVTASIARLMHPKSTLIAVEIDPDMAAITQSRVPEATVLTCGAEHLAQRLMDMGIERVDQFLSGLPMPSLPQSVNRSVLDCWQRFAPQCDFVQLTIMPWVYMPMYKRVFDQVRFALVTRNVPPAGVYFCRGLRPDYDSPKRLPGLKRKA